jgi:hypothetical protein
MALIPIYDDANPCRRAHECVLASTCYGYELCRRDNAMAIVRRGTHGRRPNLDAWRLILCGRGRGR